MTEKPLIDSLGALVKLGLREKEARVYLALLGLGECSAGQIARASGVHPRSTYDSLDSLVARGMVSFSEKAGVRIYCACALNSLLGLVEVQKSLVEGLMPMLESQLLKHKAPLVRVFRGKEGLRFVWEDMLKEKTGIFWYGGAMQGFRFHMRDYLRLWNKRREKLGIPIKFIFIDQPGVRQAIKPLKLLKAKPLPENLYSSVPWWLYGDKMAIVFWSEEPLAILIESAELAKTYRNFFNLVWKSAVRR